MSDATLRQWAMLRIIPRAPRKISASDILKRLKNEYGHTIDIRSVQRDLDHLGEVFEIEADVRSKPYGWSWRKNKALDILPSMDSYTALTFNLAKQQLSSLLPRPALSQLEPYFVAAQKVLKGDSKSPAGQWGRKIRAIPNGQRLIPAKVTPAILETVYQALLDNRQFATSYVARDSETPNELVVNPLGLVVRDAVTYLVCTISEYPDTRMLALHRMRKVAILDTTVKGSSNFDLDDYIASGAFGFHGGKTGIKTIKLKALFSSGAAFHLREQALSKDQILTERVDGHVLLEATVLLTAELRWWLQAFGSGVEVKAPKALRDAFRTDAQAMAKLYS